MKRFVVVFVLILTMIFATACGASPTSGASVPQSSGSPTTGQVTPASTAVTSDPSTPPTTDPNPTESATEGGNEEYKQIGKDLMASESFGGIKIGMTNSELIAIIGEPDTKANPSVLAADGKNHADWTYQSRGLRINMVEADTSGSKYLVYSINAVAPCDLATKKGIKIGDPEESVIAEYGDAIDYTYSVTTPNVFVAGSTSGGIVFGLEKGKVTIIFIGAVDSNS